MTVVIAVGRVEMLARVAQPVQVLLILVVAVAHRQIVAERERLIASLRELPVDVFPSGANFVLFRPRTAGGRAVWKALVERSVLVRDCSSWPRLTDCLRVTIGTPEENDRFVAALEESLKELTL